MFPSGQISGLHPTTSLIVTPLILANFHLRNGAIMWRLNWMADKSARGMNRSYGMMVNYKYDLAQIERNNKQYIIDGIIATSDSVYQLVK